MVRVAVVGAGIIGLASAVNIQNELPQAEVTIIADKFEKDTTSNGAGGYFRAHMGDIAKGVDPKVADQWVRDSWEFYYGLATSELAGETGQSIVSGHIVAHEPQNKYFTLMKELAPEFCELSQEQLKKMNLSRYKYGYAFTTVITQPRFMTWLMEKFKNAGGKVKRSTISGLKELNSSFDIVVNCCGLRGAETVQDSSMYPIKGHLIYLQAPWQKRFFFTTDGTYLLPHDDKLIVGGLKDKGNWSMSLDQDISKQILSRATALVPQLKGAKIIGEWIGLRPGRESGTRLEFELLDCDLGRKLPVVHNYGHGGHGITLGWGCGRHAARLVKEAAHSLKARL